MSYTEFPELKTVFGITWSSGIDFSDVPYLPEAMSVWINTFAVEDQATYGYWELSDIEEQGRAYNSGNYRYVFGVDNTGENERLITINRQARSGGVDTTLHEIGFSTPTDSFPQEEPTLTSTSPDTGTTIKISQAIRPFGEELVWGYDSTYGDYSWMYDDYDVLAAGGGRYGQHLVVVGHNCVYFSAL